jgi:integrase
MPRDNRPWFRKSKGCWYVWIDDRQVSLGTDRKEAFKKWHVILAGCCGESLTVRQALEHVPLEGLAPASARNYCRFCDPFVEALSNRLVSDLTHAAVLSWLDRQVGWGESTRWLCLTILQAAFGRVSEVNPLKGLKKPRLRSRGDDALVRSERHQELLAEAPQHIRDALTLLNETGCHPAELVSVEARHFSAGCLILDRHKTATKTGKTRIIVLSRAANGLVQGLAERHPDGPLFRRPDGSPLRARDVGDWLYRHNAGVIPYAYRHSLATDALLEGIADAVVAGLLGHTGTAVLHRHYNHIAAKAQAMREALGKVR